MITIPVGLFFMLLLAVFLGALLALAGVALGGLFVFRTKREPYESLFKVGPEKGEAYVVDDIDENGIKILDRLTGKRGSDPPPDESGVGGRFARMEEDFTNSQVGKHNARFREQMVGEVGGKE